MINVNAHQTLIGLPLRSNAASSDVQHTNEVVLNLDFTTRSFIIDALVMNQSLLASDNVSDENKSTQTKANNNFAFTLMKLPARVEDQSTEDKMVQVWTSEHLTDINSMQLNFFISK